MIDVPRRHARSHVPHIGVTWNIEKSIGFSYFCFDHMLRVVRRMESRLVSEPLSIFTSLNGTICCYCRFSHSSRSAFMSINSVLSQPLDRRNTEIKQSTKIEILSTGCHTSYTLSTRTRPYYLLLLFSRQPFVSAPRISSDPNTTSVCFASTEWMRAHRTHQSFVVIYFIKQYFSGICIRFSISFFIVRPRPVTLSARRASMAKFSSPLSLSSQRNNQFHYMKLNWWLIAIPIYP